MARPRSRCCASRTGSAVRSPTSSRSAAAVSIPVLAKEFVVDRRQLSLVRAAGADLVLLLASLHRGARLSALVREARDLGLEPLVEAHDERELDAALATDARVIGLNNRDLRTLAVDPERAARLRERIPEDRLAIAESGVREPATVSGWRALGYDAALIGEALMRSGDPATAVAAYVAAGRAPADPANRRPDGRSEDLRHHRCRRRPGGGRRGRRRHRPQPRPGHAPRTGPRGSRRPRAPRPRTALRGRTDADRGRHRGRAAGRDGRAPPRGRPGRRAAVRRRAAGGRGRDPSTHLEGAARGARCRRRPGRSGACRRRTGPRVPRSRHASALLLDTAGGPHPGGTGQRADESIARLVARELPITLAGGLTAANVAGALRAIPAIGVDVASGVEGPRVPGERPRKDAFRVALFAKRARAARLDRPTGPARPTPVDPGLLDADDRGRWGPTREFGGRYVPETLMAAIRRLEEAWSALRVDPRYWAELRELLERYAGRPTPLYRADRLAAETLADVARLAPAAAADLTGLRLYLKREDLAHTGAHKINNALGQALLTRRLGKTRVIAETGAGQHGVATATACALLGLPCVVYMGAEDIARQRPNVLRMDALGAEVRPVTSGSSTLKDAINEAMRDWVTNVETTHYVIGSAMGPHPYPTLVRDLQRTIGDEAAAQIRAVEGRLPDLVLACVGGGSNAIGLLARFIGEPDVRLAVTEAAGEGIATGRHAAAVAGGTAGILHGARSLMLQDQDGQVVEAHSISAGLDYPGVGPQIAALAIERAGRADRGHRPGGDRRAAPGRANRGHPARARDEPCVRGTAAPAGGHRRRRRVPRRTARPARAVRAWRQGPRGPGAAVVTLAIERELGTNDTAGARRIHRAFARARAEGRPALIPYVVAGYPDPETSLEVALAVADAGADILEVGLPYSDPLADGATLQRASTAALRAGATLEAALTLIERIGAARPDLPLVPMAYANQIIGGGDGAPTASRLARAGAAGLIVADLTPGRGRARSKPSAVTSTSRSSTSSRRRRRPSGAPGSRLARADSSTACRSSA